ncbi:MAG: Eco57I restriction-modification methylase domain-containing protein [Candidatus Omnitrophota bacterium]
MDKTEAARRVRETLQDSFNKERFVYFVKELLNKIDESKAFHVHGYVPEIFKDYVKTYERIGTYTDPEGKKADILIVYLQKETNLARARTAQRNFAARYLKDRGEKDAGLIAFVSPDQEDWRFSFVGMEYRFEQTPQGTVKIKEEFTPARRYSFLVGKNENSHTAQSCLLPILEDDVRNPTLKQIEEAFSIEKVTREFFENYRGLFLRTKESLDEIVQNNSLIQKDFSDKGVETIDFAKKLLGQIVFLYFLQKKGWFGVERNKLWGTGPKNFLRQLFEKKHGDYRDFFNDILEPLFYEALADGERSKDFYSRFNCKIPFLNGGLFDPINNYDWVDTDVCLPDELFSNSLTTREGDVGSGILDIFDRYNFTVREDEPLEKEVAVDPEMLGKVFENLLAVKDRKAKGTYYTPREIVHYMCQESLINYLTTELSTSVIARGEAPRQSPTREDIETLIKHGETAVEHDRRVKKKGRETKDYSYKLSESIRNNAELVDEKLKNIRVCDPAVGSGAFLVGMMSEIVKTRNALTVYLKGCQSNLSPSVILSNSEEPRGRTFYDFKHHAIQNCLYGVDIDPGAVEIAKLRLWLSLVVDEEDIRKIKPLPNLDYKIMQGNSLLEEYEGIKLIDERFFEKEESQGEAIGKLKDKQSDLQGEYINLHGKSQLSPIRKQQIEHKLKEITRQIQNLQQGRGETPQHGMFAVSEPRKKAEQILDLKQKFFEISQKTAKDKLKKEIENLSWELIEATLKEQGKQDKIEDIVRFRKANIKPFFLWKLHFAEVFQEKGGFDVVIANPPYVSAIKFVASCNIQDRKNFNSIFETAKGAYDLYVLFFERGIKLLHDGGVLSFISPNKYLSANYAIALREFILKNASLNQLVDISGIAVFDQVAIYPVLTFINKGYLTSGNTIKLLLPKVERLEKFGPQSFKSLIVDSDALRSLPENLWGFLLSDHLALLLKLIEGTEPLSSLGYINASSTASESDEYSKFIANHPSGRSLRIINTGTIDPYISLWGVSEFTNKGKKFLTPYLTIGKKNISERRMRLYFKQKIIFAKMAKRCEAFLDIGGEYASLNTNFFFDPKPGVSLKYITAFCNSRMFMFLYSQFFGALRMSGGYYQFQSPQLRVIPIRKPSMDVQSKFDQIIDEILAVTRLGNYFSSSDKQAKVKEYEHQIDLMVYKLYGLPPEEIEIVENFNNREQQKRA